jgi:outer membrane protein assembly factor BamD (BamD/ComL family)
LPTEPDSKGLLPSTWGSKREKDQEEPGSWVDRAEQKIKRAYQRVTGTLPNDRIARALFEEAAALYQEEEFAKAADRFERAAKRAADPLLREDAWFLAGESWFFADCYARANKCYDRLLEEFDYTRFLDTVVRRKFLIARYWEQVGFDTPLLLSLQFTDPSRPRFDTLGHALKTYQSIRLHDPTGPLADDAIMATAGIYFRKTRYGDAAEEYAVLRKEYPKSEHLRDAYLLGLQATLASYQGPAYDAKPLEQARDLTYQTLRLFGAELGEEKDRLLEIDRRITEALAERDLALAQFYEKKRRYGAARFYYRSVLEEYPLTEAAQLARERLAAIQDFPERPPNYFAWLERVLPDERRR